MWIFCNDSFVSIVAHRDNPGALLVRARSAGDIEALFPGARVTMTPNADYMFRAAVRREHVASVIAERLESIDYDNFKGSLRPSDTDRHHAYMGVWSAMHDYQLRQVGLGYEEEILWRT